MHARIGHWLQIVAVDDQFTLGVAGIMVIRAFLAVAAQTIQIRLRAGENQRGFATGRITNDPDLISIDERREHRVAEGRGDCFGNLDRPPIQIAQGAEAAVVFGVVAGMNHRDHHKALACQRGGEVMQRQRRSGVAVRQHQHRKTTDGHLGVSAGLDGVTLKQAAMFAVAGRIEGDGAHRLQIQRIEECHFVVTDTPDRVSPGRGMH